MLLAGTDAVVAVHVIKDLVPVEQHRGPLLANAEVRRNLRPMGIVLGRVSKTLHAELFARVFGDHANR